jgi:hypothetical protein
MTHDKHFEPHERLSMADQLEPLRESYEEHYGNEGDISAMLERAAAQRRLEDVLKQKPETD